QKKPLYGSKIMLLGVAYKPDVDDYRESPALRIIDLLESEGADVRVYDPYVPKFKTHSGQIRETATFSDEALRTCDCALIITGHRAFDYQRIVELAPLIVDTRNMTRDVVDIDRTKIELL
ncbi:MAG: UDP-N-acetyl-D-glucosamine dehydrogenase, partial [Oscillochloris sp.]|nr:UDP-N-acetyl-D-glucosamine dehydrogenase [Oscillochloris sp.]